MANLFYDLFHAGAALMALGATLAFIATFLRRGANTPQKRWLRVASLVVAGGALAALLVVTSPLEYRTAAPIPRETTVYVVSMTNDLYALLATDGSRLFIRHLPEFQLQQILYREEGILIISDAGHGVPIQPSGTGYYLYANTNTLHALRADDGQEVMPSLGALGNVTTWLLDHGVLYVTNIDAPAHPDRETLYAFSLHRGAPLWHRPLSAPSAPKFGGIDQGALYVTLGTRVAAVRLMDGALVWQTAPLTVARGQVRVFAPAQAGGVYVRLDADGPGAHAHTSPKQHPALIKLRENDGQPVWSVPRVVGGGIAGDRLYAILADATDDVAGSLAVFNTSDGALVWTEPAITISLQRAYTSTDGGALYLLGRRTAPAGAAPGAPLPPDECEIFALRLSDGANLWRRQPPNAPLVCAYPRALREANGILYYTTIDGYLTALRSADGGVLWTHAGYRRVGMCCHWNDTFAVEAVAPQVIFVDANHAGPCQFLVFGCDPEDTNRDDAGHYLEAVDPATGALYWRYRVDIYDVFSALLATGS